MTILTNKRALRTATGLAALAAGFGIATAAPANAADTSGVSRAASAVGPVSLAHHGAQTHFRTKVWGHTQVCVTNIGWSGGEATIQTWLGADPEYLPLSAGETKCPRRWWGGVPITVTNSGHSPLTASTK